MNNKKILLITTIGCEACTIMDGIVKEALTRTSKSIEYECKSYVDVDIKLRNSLHLRDFPTIVFLIDDTVKFSYVGTMPVTVVLRWIDIHFK